MAFALNLGSGDGRPESGPDEGFSNRWIHASRILGHLGSDRPQVSFRVLYLIQNFPTEIPGGDAGGCQKQDDYRCHKSRGPVSNQLSSVYI